MQRRCVGIEELGRAVVVSPERNLRLLAGVEIDRNSFSFWLTRAM